MDKERLKRQAAQAALEYVPWDSVVGVGTGSTVNHFIESLASIKNKITKTVASSEESARRLKALNIPVVDFNSVDSIDIYIDGADEINHHLQMIKGGGGALTREKIIGYAAKKFVCIADQTKYVELLGTFPLAIEVIPMARSFVARELVKIGGRPEYRVGFVTDNGNVILDTYMLDFKNPALLEQQLNNITGVVCHGLFATRPADVLLLARPEKIEKITR